MRAAIWAAAAAVLVAASPARARTPVPVENFPDQPVATASGRRPTLEQVQQAIASAATARQWALAKQADGSFLATRVVKGKHTLVTAVSFTAERYSVTYHSSDNLKYEVYRGVPYIHPNYNVWTRELVEAIRIELSKL
ncbi:MAG TPA: hypothetical protein VF841_12870 [Anaeromyxobacter sp.]